jgi:hypothetical protein
VPLRIGIADRGKRDALMSVGSGHKKAGLFEPGFFVEALRNF